MATMTDQLIEALFTEGVNVFEEKQSLENAVETILRNFPSQVAESSANFYIGLVKKYITGQGSTWNQNSKLVVYYVTHLNEKYGPEIGRKALSAAMHFAESKSRQSLITKLHNLQMPSPEKPMAEANTPQLTVEESISQIEAYIKAKGFTYEPGLIRNFYLTLKSKPFVILAGISGTGKTKLVELFAEAIGAEYKLVSVRPDWSDGSDLFGHYDLNGRFVEGAICDAFKVAKMDSDKPVFVCLDEMNLARVEYYLSDFLSVIESRRKGSENDITTDKIAQYENGIPSNLYFIGTVNMDETTFPFSKKVLDRANTIEFNDVNLIPDFSGTAQTIAGQNLTNEFLSSRYLVLATDCAAEQEFVIEIGAKLQKINEILAKANAHVGYRVRDEIAFYMLYNRECGLLGEEVAFDNEIMQKILPRIQGSSGFVKEMLCELYKHLADSGDTLRLDEGKASSQMQKYISENEVKYPKSLTKIAYMVERFEEDGFTTYWL